VALTVFVVGVVSPYNFETEYVLSPPSDDPAALHYTTEQKNLILDFVERIANRTDEKDYKKRMAVLDYDRKMRNGTLKNDQGEKTPVQNKR
jgi:hypothetical protein